MERVYSELKLEKSMKKLFSLSSSLNLSRNLKLRIFGKKFRGFSRTCLGTYRGQKIYQVRHTWVNIMFPTTWYSSPTPFFLSHPWYYLPLIQTWYSSQKDKNTALISALIQLLAVSWSNCQISWFCTSFAVHPGVCRGRAVVTSSGRPPQTQAQTRYPEQWTYSLLEFIEYIQRMGTGWPVKHGRVFLEPYKKVTCPVCTCTEPQTPAQTHYSERTVYRVHRVHSVYLGS